jgi:hypothetical protein
MSRVAKPPERMILPMAEVASGEVNGHRLVCDDRIPIRLSYDRPARLPGYWDRPWRCPDGRHLWDALVASAPQHVSTAEGDAAHVERLRFRLGLTCARCGRIERLEGLSDEEGRCGPHRVEPQPLQAGGLLAQQVGADRYGGDLTSWAVYERADGAPIGCIIWGRGLRGRHYFQGRLDALPGHQTVQARTVVGCLRKLAQADRAGVAGDVP